MKMSVGRLEELRLRRGLSRKEIARMLNVHESTYGKYELGKRQLSPEMLQRIANFHEVSIDYLLGRTSNEKSPGIEPELEGLEGIDFAFIGDYKTLTERDKQTIREIARLLKERGPQ